MKNENTFICDRLYEKAKKTRFTLEIIFPTHILDKRQVLKIYEELSKLNLGKNIWEKTNIPIIKQTKDMNKHFREEDLQMINFPWKDVLCQ